LPIIGYIERENQIQQDLIDSLSLLFEGQSYMYNVTGNFILGGIADDLNITFEGNPLLNDVFGINTTSPVLNMTLWNPIGNITFKPFASHKEFDEYVTSLDFGKPEHPGICFGFDI
jgi:hypothetical protein